MSCKDKEGGTHYACSCVLEQLRLSRKLCEWIPDLLRCLDDRAIHIPSGEPLGKVVLKDYEDWLRSAGE
jgi:hypothetical protein